MENNKSKLNTYLLILLIVLVLIILVVNISGNKLVKSNTGINYYQQEQQGQISNNTISEQSQNTNSNSKLDNSNNPNEVFLDLSTDFARNYKTILSEALKKPANFYNHYVVVSIGCGTSCDTFYIVDKLTGKSYKAPISNDYGGYEISLTPFTIDSNLIKIVTKSGSEIRTYSFDGTNFNLIKTENK